MNDNISASVVVKKVSFAAIARSASGSYLLWTFFVYDGCVMPGLLAVSPGEIHDKLAALVKLTGVD